MRVGGCWRRAATSARRRSISISRSECSRETAAMLRCAARLIGSGSLRCGSGASYMAYEANADSSSGSAFEVYPLSSSSGSLYASRRGFVRRGMSWFCRSLLRFITLRAYTTRLPTTIMSVHSTIIAHVLELSFLGSGRV